MKPIQTSCALALLWLVCSPASASTVYKCVINGTTLYSHLPCEPGADPVALPELGRLGSLADAEQIRSRLQALRDLPVVQRRTSTAPARRGLSYGERINLRKLEMRADSLRRELLRQHGNPTWRRSVGEELEALQERINELRARE